MDNAAFAKRGRTGQSGIAATDRAGAGDSRRWTSHLPTTLGEEKAANPFLRTETSGVLRALRERLGRAPADSVEAFAELRRWKDGFVA